MRAAQPPLCAGDAPGLLSARLRAQYDTAVSLSDNSWWAEAIRKYPPSAQVRLAWDQSHSIFAKQPKELHRAVYRLVPTYAGTLTAEVLEQQWQNPLWHIGALALSAWDSLIAHRLDAEALEYVREHRLGSYPDEAPRLLTRPWLVEVLEPDKGQRLFGDTIALASYFDPLMKQWFLLGWTPLGNNGVYWPQKWASGPVKDMDVREIGVEWQGDDWEPVSQELAPKSKGHEWYNQAVQFATIFGVVMEAAHSALRQRDERSGLAPKKQPAPGRKPPLGWVMRTVFLDREAAEQESEADAPPAPLPGAAASSSTSWSSEGKTLHDVKVKEHRRRQRFGPGNSQVRWICVKSYQSQRWTSSKPVRVVVRMK